MTNHPDLFSPAPYVGDSDTSRNRAHYEDESGTTTNRQRAILNFLSDKPEGLNWRELGSMLDLHHGQISGALSVMHRDGHIYQLTTKRHNCHVYIHPHFADTYPANMLVLEPVKTFATKERIAMDAVIDAARQFAKTGLGFGHVAAALRNLDAVRGNK